MATRGKKKHPGDLVRFRRGAHFVPYWSDVRSMSNGIIPAPELFQRAVFAVVASVSMPSSRQGPGPPEVHHVHRRGTKEAAGRLKGTVQLHRWAWYPVFMRYEHPKRLVAAGRRSYCTVLTDAGGALERRFAGLVVEALRAKFRSPDYDFHMESTQHVQNGTAAPCHRYVHVVCRTNFSPPLALVAAWRGEAELK